MRDAAQFSFDFSRWWKKRAEINQNFDIKHKYDIFREGNLVFLKFCGIDSIFIFDNVEKERGTLDMSVLFSGLSKAIEPELKMGENSQYLNGKELLNTYRAIFGRNRPLSVNIGEVKFEEVIYNGLLITAKALNVPYGKGGGLSDNLFEYFRKGIVAPVYDFIKGGAKERKTI